MNLPMASVCVLLLLLIGLPSPSPIHVERKETAQAQTPDAKRFVDVTVVVTDQAGAAIPGAQIKLTPEALVRLPKNPKTDATGRLQVQLIPGVYYLFAAEPTFLPTRKGIAVYGPGQFVTVVLPVAETTQTVFAGRPDAPPAASANVAIIVTDAKGAPVPYAQIAARPAAWATKFSWEADEHGKLSVKLPPGAYQFAVTSPAYQRWTEEIRIRYGESRTIQILLAKVDI